MHNGSDSKNDTRKRILDLAEELLLTRGFNGFSYQHISSALGVRNAAIHYHFPKKSDLGVALIQRYRRRFQRFVDQQGEWDAARRLEAYFGLSDQYYLQHKQICPSGILSTEFQTLPDDMRQEASAFIDEMRRWAVAIVRLGRESGQMDYAGSPEAVGMMLFSALQGGLQLARIDEDALPLLKSQVRTTLGMAETQE
ncbi:DNA-binding protein, AcrR family, includes nucleoid occlusion protein SlmA [Chromobacterium violaceum]|uniref:HTH-type transcriptional repressor nemR n=3 Tax=Chromobacterium violaceum TaxID=536 RepID=A0A202B7K0_CHRVL|nr:TetR/AcrR family transcriptional regulator [Chromobacterium violaceum]AAQ60158.1 probable transcriptional regulator, TetR family [Chromobacterium violaceum ATCC 12472]ATP28937.1 TetR/AcrR family transcriptional regulator [Chromobacterium violaceum]ATP32848.1 TetR/AcrR family transcriptional regulator [Chromobacterium violaceum]KJH67834.1 TetR family transcriptional regulator [Chromobacterium violaceum]KMN49238.1 TetR family transcriptional regulator [Chromobacterium violaceum]